VSNAIRASYVDMGRARAVRASLEQALCDLTQCEVVGWRLDQLDGRLDACARNADLVVLDETEHDGERSLAAATALRARHPMLAIVAAIRAPTCAATVALLDAGVDEVVDTTADVSLAIARITGVVRRRQQLLTPAFSEVGNLRFDHANHRVWNADRQLRLSPLEYAFLDCLVSAGGKSVGTRTLSDFVWTSNGRAPRSKNAVQVYVGYLRRKLSIAQVTIQNVRGKGYRLVAESLPSSHSAG
jgi:DNA-binding response OmpR family regulator